MTLRSLSELPAGTNPPRATGGSGEQVAWLLKHFQGGGLITNNTWAAALQLAIWEVLHETSPILSVTNGNGVFYLTNSGSYSSAAANANWMLSHLGSHRSTSGVWLDW